MERKNRIWLTVLLVLLIAAIAAVVVIHNQKAEKAAQLVSTSAVLEEERGKYLTLEEALATATGEVEQLTADKAALEIEINTLHTKIDEAEVALADAAADAAAQGEAATAARSELEGLKVKVFDLEAEAAAVDEKLSEKTLEIEGLQADLAVMTEAVEAREQEIEAKERQIQVKDREIVAKAQEIEVKEQEIQAKDQEIEAKAQEIEAKEQEIKVRDQEIQAKAQEIEAKEIEVQALQSSLALITAAPDAEALSEKIAELQADIAARDAQIEKLEAVAPAGRQLEALNAEIAEKLDEVEALNTEIAAKELEIEALLATEAPTAVPTEAPTAIPTIAPTEAPTAIPTEAPTAAPADNTLEDVRSDVEQIMAEGSGLTDDEKLQKLTDLEAQLSARAAELETALAELNAKKAELDSANTQLAAANAQLDSANTQLAEANTTLSDIEAQLAAANESVVALEGRIESGNATIADLESKIAAAEGALAEANSTSLGMKAELESQLTALNHELSGERQALAEMEAEHALAQQAFAQRLSELQAYRIERIPGEGQSHLSTQLGSVLVFDESGVEGTATIENTITSGNSIVFELTLNGAPIFTSDPIAPGESLETIRLADPLAKGNYEAVAAQRTFDAEGNYISAVRIPVILIVG